MEEHLHSAAFSGVTLGQSLQAGAAAHKSVTKASMQAYHDAHFHVRFVAHSFWDPIFFPLN